MLVVSILLGLAVIAQNVLIAQFLNDMLYQKMTGITTLLWVILTVLIIRALIQYSNQWLGDTLAFKVKYQLRQRMLTANVTHDVGKQLAIVTESIDGLAPFFKDYLPQVFKSTMVPLIIIVAMCFIHLNTAIIMLLTAPFIPLFYIIFGLKTRDESKDQMTYLNQFSQRFLNTAKGLITLKIFRQTQQTEQELYEDSTRFRDLTMRILKSAFLSGLMLEFISMLGIGLVALEATLSLVVFNTIDFKTAAIAIILAPEFYNAIKDLGQAFHTGKQSEGASDVVFDFLDDEKEKDFLAPIVNRQQTEQIKLSNVSFKYQNSDKQVIKQMNLSIHQGEKIALVGPSGAGKSTLVQLLAHHFVPTQGQISYNQPSLSIGMLSQHPYIFAASIKDNISMFSNISDKQIEAVLQQVGLLAKVKSLSHGINTVIGEGGEMLSGGQMRRIELCRLLVTQPDIVIFDEPATGLDVQTEHIMQQVLFNHFKDQTMIVIAHRDKTIQRLQRRLYLEQGVVIRDDHTMNVNLNRNGDK